MAATPARVSGAELELSDARPRFKLSEHAGKLPSGTAPALTRTAPSSVKGRGMNFRTCSALLQAVATAVVVAGCATSQKASETQEAPETYAWAPVRPPAVPGTGLPSPGQPGQVRPQPLPRSPHKRVLPPTREPGLWAGDAPRASQEPEASPAPKGTRANRSAPPPPVTLERRPECQPIFVPHAGGDDAHDVCADKFPPNRYPGMDVLVAGVRFDALQVGVRMLWEIKTHKFDTYPAFVQEREIEKEMEQIREEKDAAAACGYGYKIGVSTQAHKEALLRVDQFLNIVVTGCKR
jgi:hypothetical protein